jgi:uncharacterized protein (DUF697 family)
MTEQKIKVKRTRRRLYESVPDLDEGQTYIEPEILEPLADEKSVLVINSREEEGQKIIRKYAMMAAGAALVPVPVLDFAAITVLEMQMLKKLSNLYEIDFSKERSKALIGSLVGGVNTGILAAGLMKFVPFLGLALAVAPIAAISSAITYAVGLVFMKHFASGGTLFDFDPDNYRTIFESEFEYWKNLSDGKENK